MSQPAREKWLVYINIYIIKISGKVNESNTYNGFISFFIQGRISSDSLSETPKSTICPYLYIAKVIYPMASLHEPSPTL